MRLHAQFKWPYPLVSQSIVEQLTKRIEGIKISSSTTSLDSLQCKLEIWQQFWEIHTVASIASI